MSKRYGIPYMGNKSRIASDIIAALPAGGVFYDLFAGGGAITHCAALSGKWERVVFNDKADTGELFQKAVHGGYKDERRWISREEFNAKKASDPYIRYCWSFGNRGTTYLYGRDIEELRRLQWEMCFAPTPYERKVRMRSVFQEAWNMGLIFARDGDGNAPSLKTKGGKLQSLESLGRLEDVQALETLSSAQCKASAIDFYRGDYSAVPIGDKGVVYCDIPYLGCTPYSDDGSVKPTELDYEAFYKWAEGCKLPVFISEYTAPADRFMCVKKWQIRCLARGGMGTNKDLATECLFLPVKWAAWWDAQCKRGEQCAQLSFIDDMGIDDEQCDEAGDDDECERLFA